MSWRATNQVACVLPTREIAFAVLRSIVLSPSRVVPLDADPGPDSVVDVTHESDCANMRMEADPRPDMSCHARCLGVGTKKEIPINFHLELYQMRSAVFRSGMSCRAARTASQRTGAICRHMMSTIAAGEEVCVPFRSHFGSILNFTTSLS